MGAEMMVMRIPLQGRTCITCEGKFDAKESDQFRCQACHDRLTPDSGRKAGPKKEPGAKGRPKGGMLDDWEVEKDSYNPSVNPNDHKYGPLRMQWFGSLWA